MSYLVRHLQAATGKPFNPKNQCIRCLAHIINLATQALILMYSKSSHYDPEKPDMVLMNVDGPRHDQVGLVRAISVKEHSSAKRKQLFKDIQFHKKVKILRQLLLDMPVRWSSTYVMLECSEELREFVDIFVYQMAREEKDLTKRQKLDKLRLMVDEWD
ncbi:uncharacterized protein LAESUDRAFT_764043 [Laetiporus sulphureus 93-53]|uniref:hAT-like transposase RNase-H fold domain-containing protein n=1 Tax=Laetiporus sulphureus 93-53 TaxID=1314785 RepID=A0A165BIG4_9APHY|nr:uncharacterized protein LAESUDRAFT_764043 [Laetiporus sulphureus 93-53]KZT01119.1 hypothetical protein LAESUDRAFT_764043 [Laetiporus sulphureus 93-53]